jgi:hypothetical protein
VRLNIGLCRHCTRNRDECEYRNDLKNKVAQIAHKGTLNHNCPLYRTCWPMGSRVEVEVKSLEVEEVFDTIEPGLHIPAGVDGEWVSLGWKVGTVVCDDCRGWVVIELDEPIAINLPERGKDWDTAREVTVEHTRRRANKIRTLGAM